VRPDSHALLRRVHRDFVRAGSRCVTTNSYGITSTLGFTEQERFQCASFAGQRPGGPTSGARARGHNNVVDVVTRAHPSRNATPEEVRHGVVGPHGGIVPSRSDPVAIPRRRGVLALGARTVPAGGRLLAGDFRISGGGDAGHGGGCVRTTKEAAAPTPRGSGSPVHRRVGLVPTDDCGMECWRRTPSRAH
jgi:Homocysteine S-methyltransferase